MKGKAGEAQWVVCLPGPERLTKGDLLNQDVVSGCAVEDVVARSADEDVVTGAADEVIIAAAADQDVIPVSSIDSELDAVRVEPGSHDHVVTVQCVDGQTIVCRLGVGEIHLRRQSGNG